MKSNRLEIQTGFEERLADLGFVLVQLEWAGNAHRPVIRLRVEHQDADRPVSLDDCATVSRHLESWLDRDASFSDRYVLEVSSPGLERPLIRDSDFQRFRGRRVAVNGVEVLCDRSTRLEGELLGLAPGKDGGAVVLLRLARGDEVAVRRASISGAHLVHDWTIS